MVEKKKQTKAKASKTTKMAKASSVMTRQITLSDDFKNAVLVVSLLINLAVFVGWLALQLTTQFDAQVFNMLFNR